MTVWSKQPPVEDGWYWAVYEGDDQTYIEPSRITAGECAPIWNWWGPRIEQPPWPFPEIRGEPDPEC